MQILEEGEKQGLESPLAVERMGGTMILDTQINTRNKIPSNILLNSVLVSSPCEISSIFITSAPRSARSIVAVGPARTLVRSTTRMPSSGGEIPVDKHLNLEQQSLGRGNTYRNPNISG